MSITVVTGTPGAGKTLYTVSQLVKGLVGTSVKHKTQTGEVVEIPRTIYTNIRGLVLDHQLINGGGKWAKDKADAVVFTGEKGGLRNWHEWAPPGAVIVFDEVQKVWEPRPNGAWVPPDIQGLETHRHMGVDFILITQHLGLMDRNVSKLTNRHLHVRRVANLPFALLYEWDHASPALKYSAAVTNKKWWYDKSAYKLYQSAEVHTKQPRGIPKAALAAVMGLVLLCALVPFFYKRMGERFGWIEAPAVSTDAKKAGTGPASGVPEPTKPAEGGKEVAPVQEVAFAGCIEVKGRCSCLASNGEPVDKGPGFCKIHTGALREAPLTLDRLVIPEQERHQAELAAGITPDADMIAAAREHAEARVKVARR